MLLFLLGLILIRRITIITIRMICDSSLNSVIDYIDSNWINRCHMCEKSVDYNRYIFSPHCNNLSVYYITGRDKTNTISLINNNNNICNIKHLLEYWPQFNLVNIYLWDRCWAKGIHLYAVHYWFTPFIFPVNKLIHRQSGGQSIALKVNNSN